MILGLRMSLAGIAFVLGLPFLSILAWFLGVLVVVAGSVFGVYG